MLVPDLIRPPVPTGSRLKYIAGSSWRAANAAICSRREFKNAPAPTSSAPAWRCTMVTKALSMSASLLASRLMSCCPIVFAAACTSICSPRACRSVRVSKHGNYRSPGHKLTQEFQPLGPQPPGEEAYARNVSAGPAETGDDAVPQRAAAGREDDRHGHPHMPGHNRRNVLADDHRLR